jgi:pilus assembly protein Flp/PilA
MEFHMLKSVAKLFAVKTQDGNAAIEYGMIAALIAVIIAASLSSVATKLIAVFASVVAAL